MREIQPPGRGLLGSHGKNVGIGACLKERESAGQDEIRNEERIVAARHFCREEEQRPDGIERQSEQDSGFVGIFADEHRRRKRHRKVAAVECDLNQSAVRHAHPEDFGKRLDHRVGDIVGESPECEARGDQNEWNDIADSVFVQK